MTGMTRAGLRRHLQENGYDVDGGPKRKLPQTDGSELERTLEFYIRTYQLPEPEREYQFCSRKWRFDFAWPNHGKLAVEVDGGMHSFGRHQRPEGYANDADKSNEAQIMGWRVLRFTGEQVKRDPAAVIDTIQRALTLR